MITASSYRGAFMEMLILAAMIWLIIHIGVSGTHAREVLVGRWGQPRFMGYYSGASVVSIVLLVIAYRASGSPTLWVPWHWLQYLCIAAMLPAAILFVGSVAGPNPTAAGQNAALGQPVHGIQRITRHPMLVAFTIWAVVHLLSNGDFASWVFFGTFAATTLAGMPSIDRKLAERDPENWRRLAASTSIVPGAAIWQGRNRLILVEISPIVWGGGALLWIVLILLHPLLIGVPVWPR